MPEPTAAPDFGLDDELAREAWALVWLPAFAATTLYQAEAITQGAWGTLWKRRGYREYRWFEPLTSSEDQAMASITAALRASPRFVNRHQGGDFYAIPVRYCVRVPGLTTHRDMRSLLIEFGLARNLETALARVEGALQHGTAFPPKTAAWWRALLAGGVVVPVPTHRRVVVSDLVPSQREAAEEHIL